MRFLFLFIFFVLMVQMFTYIAIEFFFKYDQLQGFAIATVVSVVIAVVFSKWTSESITSVIRVFVSAARALEHGEKRAPVNLKRRDEFRMLEDAVNNLIDRDKALRDANEDPLTGLANRRYLLQRLGKMLEQSVPLAVMFIDLDGFKPINDEYGHDVGDEALRVVSDRMGGCIRESDVLARIGGDEFIIMFTGLEDREVLVERADKVLEMVGTPMWISGNRIRMGASIGISVAPKDGTDTETIINAADESMYAAKQGGKNAYRFYS